MKILMISIFPPAEVPEADHAYHQCLHLADAGHEVHVLTQGGSTTPTHPRIHVNAVMEYWCWAEMLPVLRSMRRTRPDTILINYVGHAYNNHPMVTFIATLARLFCRKVPCVTQVTYPSGASVVKPHHRILHTLAARSFGQRQPSAFGTLLRDSKHIIVLSNNHVATLERQEPSVSEKVVLIPPPVIMPLASKDDNERQMQRSKLGIRSDETLLAFFGYIYRGKGIETLFKAFSLVCAHGYDVKLILVGGGAIVAPGGQDSYVTELRQLMQELRIEDRVVFTGGFSWSSDQASRYLRAADVAVLPFDNGVQLNNSSFAAVVTHGLPTVTTRSETLEQPFIHRSNVFLCPPQDVKAMAAALEEVITDADLRNRLHFGALELMQSCFSWQTATEVLVSSLMPPTAYVSQSKGFR